MASVLEQLIGNSILSAGSLPEPPSITVTELPETVVVKNERTVVDRDCVWLDDDRSFDKNFQIVTKPANTELTQSGLVPFIIAATQQGTYRTYRGSIGGIKHLRTKQGAKASVNVPDRLNIITRRFSGYVEGTLFEHNNNAIRELFMGANQPTDEPMFQGGTTALQNQQFVPNRQWVFESLRYWFSSVVAYRYNQNTPSNSGHESGGILVTRNCLLSVGHAGPTHGNTVTFCDQDGTIHQRTVSSYVSLTGANPSVDLLVAKLTQPAPETVPVMAIVPPTWHDHFPKRSYGVVPWKLGAKANYVDIPRDYGVLQHNSVVPRNAVDVNGRYITEKIPALFYINLERNFLGECRESILGFNAPDKVNTDFSMFGRPCTDPLLSSWYRDAMGGTSGRPICMLINGRPVLRALFSTPGTGPSTAFNHQRIQSTINSLMGHSNDTLTFANLSAFPTF